MLKHFHNLLTTLRRLGVSPRVMVFLFGLNLVAILFEGLGVAMLLPIFELLRGGGSLDSVDLKGKHWETLHYVFASVGLPVNLGTLLALSFCFILARQVVNYLNVQSRSVAIRTTANKIRQRAFRGFLTANTGLQERTRVGDIAGDLTVELSRALSAIFAVIPATGHAIQVAVYTGGLFLLSIPMTLVAIGMIGLAVFFTQGYLLEVKRSGAAITDANMQLTAFIVERLKHVRLIRLSATERAEAEAFGRLSQRHSEESMRQNLIGARISLLPEPLMLGFGYIVLFVGGQILGLGLDRLALFVVVLIRLLPVVRGIAADYNAIIGKWPSVEKLDCQLKNVLDTREERGGDKRFEKLDQGVAYEHVSFSYGGQRVAALKDVTVFLPAHRMSALVGPSGAGKSTFVDLLPRLRDPTAGRILIDGVPITEFSMESLRAGIAFVPQQAQIFNSKVAEHIRYGKENATDEEVREAAWLAGALPFIEALPRGFDTLLGDNGLGLSIGQRQRLDIARAMVRRAPILILDEPTSALDAEAEGAFRDALRSLRAHTRLTIIVIAHRLSTIADADQIVVLRKGRVEAVGSHDELLAAGGWYAHAFKQQNRSAAPKEVRMSAEG